MTTTASARLESKVNWDSTDNDEAIAPDRNKNQFKVEQSFTSSTSRRIYAKTLTVPVGSLILDIDLTALEDVNNQSITFTAVEAIQIENNNTTSLDSVLIGPQGATNGWATPWDSDNDAKVVLGPGDVYLRSFKTDTVAVNGTNKVLRFTMNGGSDDAVTVDVIIIGTV